MVEEPVRQGLATGFKFSPAPNNFRDCNRLDGNGWSSRDVTGSLHGLANLLVFDSGLLENAVSRMSRFDVVINREFSVVDRAIPDFMIALSRPIKTAFGDRAGFA